MRTVVRHANPRIQNANGHVTGFLTRQLDIYHTIPLPITLECKPAYASQITIYDPGMPIPECEPSCEPAYKNPPIPECERSCEPAQSRNANPRAPVTDPAMKDSEIQGHSTRALL